MLSPTSMRNRHFLLGDLLFVPLAAYLAFVFRLEAFNLTSWWLSFLLFASVALVVTLAIFQALGLYARLWRYASVRELTRLGGGVALATALTSAVTFVVPIFVRGLAHPRTVPLIFFLLCLAFTAGPRLLMRAVRARPAHGPARATTPTLIIGAGRGASMLLRELQQSPDVAIDVVGLIDDDPLKRNSHLHGVRVLGPRSELAALAAQHHAEKAIIAIPGASGPLVREIVRQCEAAGLEPKILPTLDKMLGAVAPLSQLRDVQIDDLLRRDPIRIVDAEVSALLRQKKVLVTGAGGSIGSELCRQIAAFEPALLVLLDHSENALFQIKNELGDRFNELRVRDFVADIRDERRLESILAACEPDIIFHAAAQKHVPLMEEHPCEAIRTNVRGTQLLVGLAERMGVPRFVMVSTDKAVNPTSVMGASKRTAELLVQAAARRTKRAYVAVRFGNVLGSNGSVVPRFQEQIARGGPVTVTHPEMRRFFMTIPEAVLLVLQAGTIGRNGEVYVLDMGEPVLIDELAKDLIRLSGLDEGEIQIVYSGIRPGEKLFEELFIDGEQYDPTHHSKVFRVRSATEGPSDESLAAKVARLVEAAEQQQAAMIRPLLQTIVREYEPAGPTATPQPEATSALPEALPV